MYILKNQSILCYKLEKNLCIYNVFMKASCIILLVIFKALLITYECFRRNTSTAFYFFPFSLRFHQLLYILCIPALKHTLLPMQSKPSQRNTAISQNTEIKQYKYNRHTNQVFQLKRRKSSTHSLIKN